MENKPFKAINLLSLKIFGKLIAQLFGYITISTSSYLGLFLIILISLLILVFIVWYVINQNNSKINNVSRLLNLLALLFML